MYLKNANWIPLSGLKSFSSRQHKVMLVNIYYWNKFILFLNLSRVSGQNKIEGCFIEF